MTNQRQISAFWVSATRCFARTASALTWPSWSDFSFQPMTKAKFSQLTRPTNIDQPLPTTSLFAKLEIEGSRKRRKKRQLSNLGERGLHLTESTKRCRFPLFGTKANMANASPEKPFVHSRPAALGRRTLANSASSFTKLCRSRGLANSVVSEKLLRLGHTSSKKKKTQTV